jgi:hypothetical protein
VRVPGSGGTGTAESLRIETFEGSRPRMRQPVGIESTLKVRARGLEYLRDVELVVGRTPTTIERRLERPIRPLLVRPNAADHQ